MPLHAGFAPRSYILSSPTRWLHSKPISPIPAVARRVLCAVSIIRVNHPLCPAPLSPPMAMGPDYHRISLAPDTRGVQTSIPLIRRSAKLQGSNKKRRCGISVYLLSHILGFIWMVPIIALLVLNFKSHRIGASIWCPRGRCNAEAYSENAIARARKLDEEDHNILGALQLASKALEAWFMVVATGLVYDVAFYLAKSSGGLPIGYILTHLEFANIKNLLNPLFWKSALPHGNPMPAESAGTWMPYMFVILAALLTLLTNLMGPATAVLVLPSLKWVDEEPIPSQVFGAFAASSPPRGDTVLPGCNDTQFSTRNYTCTSALYGPSLDKWAAQLLSTAAQAGQDYGAFLLGTTQEGSVETTINITQTNSHLVWVPNRQTLRDLSHDLFDLGSYVTGTVESNNKTTTYQRPAFNNSLETVLQRQGPSLGMTAACFEGNLTINHVADNRQIRCLDGWSAIAGAFYTKCYRAGIGWGKTNGIARFYLGGTDEEEESYVEVYSSDKATYFNATTDFGSGIRDCIHESAADCDWDQPFEAEFDNDLKNSTTNALISEYAHPLYNSTRYWCEAIVYSAFPTYAVNTAQWINPLSLVNMKHLPVETDRNFNRTPIAVHPDWVLAAWSVAHNGTVNRSREIGKVLARLIAWYYEGDPPGDVIIEYTDFEFLYLHLYSMAQSLSLINYSYSNDTTSLAAAAQARDNGKPIFSKWATLRVWAYGLNGRTPILGVIVAIIGCICVLLRVILAASLSINHEHSTLDLFVAALENQPTGEFDGLDKEATMAKVRYIMQDGEKRPKFVSERVYSSGVLKTEQMA